MVAAGAAAPLERTLELRGKSFVLVEPAGSGRLPIGRLAPGSVELLQAGEISGVVWMTG